MSASVSLSTLRCEQSGQLARPPRGGPAEKTRRVLNSPGKKKKENTTVLWRDEIGANRGKNAILKETNNVVYDDIEAISQKFFPVLSATDLSPRTKHKLANISQMFLGDSDSLKKFAAFSEIIHSLGRHIQAGGVAALLGDHRQPLTAAVLAAIAATAAAAAAAYDSGGCATTTRGKQMARPWRRHPLLLLPSAATVGHHAGGARVSGHTGRRAVVARGFPVAAAGLVVRSEQVRRDALLDPQVQLGGRLEEVDGLPFSEIIHSLGRHIQAGGVAALLGDHRQPLTAAVLAAIAATAAAAAAAYDSGGCATTTRGKQMARPWRRHPLLLLPSAATVGHHAGGARVSGHTGRRAVVARGFPVAAAGLVVRSEQVRRDALLDPQVQLGGRLEEVDGLRSRGGNGHQELDFLIDSPAQNRRCPKSSRCTRGSGLQVSARILGRLLRLLSTARIFRVVR
ncbi:unnamed protein product, partial [Notodromas monacha]